MVGKWKNLFAAAVTVCSFSDPGCLVNPDPDLELEMMTKNSNRFTVIKKYNFFRDWDGTFF